MADGIGLSIGTANLTAVHVGRTALRRSAVLTRYPHRPSEVGVPAENPNLSERGLIITDFVDRVGDPVALVAPDGSSHRAEQVLADALRALLVTVTGRQSSAEPVAVAYPAYWRPAAVDALRGALAGFEEFRAPLPALVVSDATAALTALQQDPGVPARGVIAVCDVGATGTTLTLADAGQGFRPIAPALRHADLSGELIDQALLTQVIADLTDAGSIDLTGTSAIGSLTRLRAQCRVAKERLATVASTSVTVDLPGAAREVRITRNELDDALREPLQGFLGEVHEALQRNGIRQSDLVAVAAVGGGARIPAVVTALSEHLRVPIVTMPQPELATAIGAGLKAVRGTVAEEATAMAPAAGPPPAMPDSGAPMSSTFAALAWSDAADEPDEPGSYGADAYDADPDYGFGEPEGDDARPRMAFEERELAEHDAAVAVPWYRRPTMLIGIGAAVVLMVVGAAIVYVLRNDSSEEPSGATMTVTPTSTTPAVPPPPAEPTEPPPAQQTQTVTEVPEPPVTVTEQPPVNQPPPPAETPPPPIETPPPTTETPTTTVPTPTTTEPPPTSNPPPWSPPYSTIPGLPYVPAPPGFPVPQP